MASTLPSVALRSGKKVPIMAFGCGTALFSQDCTRSIEQAISSGFHLLDTAEVYKNSQFVGDVISSSKQAKVKEDLMVIGKLGNMKEIYQGAMEEREKLKVGKFDLLLLHSPPRGDEGKPSNVEAWKIMEQLKDEGVTDVIGVSNWLASDLQQVLDSNPKHAIEVNQIEYHPSLAATEQYQALLPLQAKEKITSMIYASLAPITKPNAQSSALDAVLDGIASKESGWTRATVLQKWASQAAGTPQADAIIVSTSNKPDRLKEYMTTFTSRKLSNEEVAEITKAGGKSKPVKQYMQPFFT